MPPAKTQPSPGTVDALDFLARSHGQAVPALCVAFGDEDFLKRLVVAEIRKQVLGADGEFSFTRFDGRTAKPREVFDELSTLALFGGRRLVAVSDADDFVSDNRPLLEDFAARPKPGGVLLLEVKSWPKTTRLYKALAAGGLQVECKTPPPAALLKWVAAWARQRHQARLEQDASELLVEMAGTELGLLDQELAKLAVSAGPDGAITPDMVADLVGGWRARTVWDMLDAALAGNAARALGQLDRLLLSGEQPVGLLAQMAGSLRRFAAATRLIERAEAAGRRLSLGQALEGAGVNKFFVGRAEPQLRQLNRQRAGKLYRWLLEADLDLKGQSALSPRVILERLIVRMSDRLGERRRQPA